MDMDFLCMCGDKLCDFVEKQTRLLGDVKLVYFRFEVQCELLKRLSFENYQNKLSLLLLSSLTAT